MSPETQGRSAQAVSGPASRSQELLVVHPRTGEILARADALEAVGDETVAEVRVALKQRIAELRQMLELVDTDLARRCDIRGRARVQMGDYEVESKPRRESVWDADELEVAVRELLDRGVLEAREITGLIKHETTVSRTKARQVVERLRGEDRHALEACRTWRVTGHGIDVTRSLELLKP